jgi:propionyl-CoA synthetase
MEQSITAHPDVAEAAVVGVVDSLKGEVPCGFMVLNSDVEKADEAVGRTSDGIP